MTYNEAKKIWKDHELPSVGKVCQELRISKEDYLEKCVELAESCCQYTHNENIVISDLKKMFTVCRIVLESSV